MHKKVVTLATMRGCSWPSEIKTVRLKDWLELKTVKSDIRKIYSTAEVVYNYNVF